MDIRKASIHDLDQLLAMRTAFIKDLHPSVSDAEIDALRQTMVSYFTHHIGHDFFGYFAIDGETTAAAVYLVVQERPAMIRFKTGKIALFLNVYTLPGYRRRGYASALLQEAIADAKTLGVSLMELQASEMGLPVYEKLGFAVKQSEFTPMEYRFDIPDDTLTGSA